MTNEQIQTNSIVSRADIYAYQVLGSSSQLDTLIDMFSDAANEMICSFINFNFTPSQPLMEGAWVRYEWTTIQGDGTQFATLKYPLCSINGTPQISSAFSLDASGKTTYLSNAETAKLQATGPRNQTIWYSSTFQTDVTYWIHYMIPFPGSTNTLTQEIEMFLQWPAAIKQVAIEMVVVMLEESRMFNSLLGRTGYNVSTIGLPQLMRIDLNPRWNAILTRYKYHG